MKADKIIWRQSSPYEVGSGRGRFRTILRIVLPLLGIAATAVILIGALLGVLLYRHAHPPRVTSSVTPTSVFTRYEDVAFSSPDGVSLSAWWIPGAPDAPAVVLAHDLGESRASLLGLASQLSEKGYNAFLLDFRGHGTSGGTSSFGTLEKRDLLGAIDWIGARAHVDAKHLGILGVGMGAHAAILAACERPQVRCTVLDSPYGSVAEDFAAVRLRGVTAIRWLTPPAIFLYDLAYGVDSARESAAQHVKQLADRNLLFLAPRTQEETVRGVRAMYDSLPEARAHDKNLILLPATGTTALYGEDRTKYDETVLGFFRSYLPVSPPAAPPQPPARPLKTRSR